MTATPTLSSQATAVEKPRSYWVDNLRTAMIILVVNLHACVTYSWVGSWYFISPDEPSVAEKIPFGIWEGHLQAFFMGLMFFIAGYFADRSLRKRKAGEFVGERLRRLGVPTLIYMLALEPLIVIGLHPGHPASLTPGQDYLKYVTSPLVIAGSGPMWFAFALLIFCLLFAAINPFLPKAEARPHILKWWRFAILAACVGLVSFLIRIVQPLGSTQYNFQLCYFAQYLTAFPLGIWVSRRNVLQQVATSPIARSIGWFGVIFGPLGLLAVVLVSPPLVKGVLPPHLGGWNWYALAFALWEQLTGWSIGMGAIYLFAKRLDGHSAFSKWLADRSFAVYLFHAPFLVWLSMAVQPFRTEALVMAVGITIITVAGTYLIADLAKRIPVLKLVL